MASKSEAADRPTPQGESGAARSLSPTVGTADSLTFQPSPKRQLIPNLLDGTGAASPAPTSSRPQLISAVPGTARDEIVLRGQVTIDSDPAASDALAEPKNPAAATAESVGAKSGGQSVDSGIGRHDERTEDTAEDPRTTTATLIQLRERKIRSLLNHGILPATELEGRAIDFTSSWTAGEDLVSGRLFVYDEDNPLMTEASISDGLTGSGFYAILPTLAERPRETDRVLLPDPSIAFPHSDHLSDNDKAIVEKRINSSIILICDGTVSDEPDFHSATRVNPDAITDVLIPKTIWDSLKNSEAGAQLASQVQIHVIEDTITENVGYVRDKSIPTQVPNYRTAIRSLVNERKKTLWAHGVRLPIEEDLESISSTDILAARETAAQKEVNPTEVVASASTLEGAKAQAKIIRDLFSGEGLTSAATDTALEQEYKTVIAEQSAKAREEVGNLMGLTPEQITPANEGQELTLDEEARSKVYDYFRSVFKIDDQIEQAKEKAWLGGQILEAAIEQNFKQLKEETEIHMIGPVLQIRFPTDDLYKLFNKLTTNGKSKGVMFPLILPGSESDDSRLSENVYVNLVTDEGDVLGGQKVDKHELWHAVDAFRYAMLQRSNQNTNSEASRPAAIEYPDGNYRFASDNKFKSRLDAYFFNTRNLADSLGQLADSAPEMYQYFFGVDPQEKKSINGDETQQDNAAVLDFEHSFFKIQDELPAFIAGFLNGDAYPINAKRKQAIINSLITNYTLFGKLDLTGLISRAIRDDSGRWVVDESVIEYTFNSAGGSVSEPNPLMIKLRKKYSDQEGYRRVNINKEAYSQDLQRVIDFFLNEGGAGHAALDRMRTNIGKSIDAYKQLAAQRDDYFQALTELSLLPVSHWDAYVAHASRTNETQPDLYKHAGLVKEDIEEINVYTLDLSDEDAKEKLANLKEIVQGKRVALEVGPGNQLDSMLFAADYAKADVVIGIDISLDSSTIATPAQRASEQSPTVILLKGDIWNSQLLHEFLNTNQEKSQRLAVYSQLVAPADTDNVALLTKLVQGVSNDGFMVVLDSGSVEAMRERKLRDDAIKAAILEREGIHQPTELDWIKYTLRNYQQIEIDGATYSDSVADGRFPHTSFLRNGTMLIIQGAITLPEQLDSQNTTAGTEAVQFTAEAGLAEVRKRLGEENFTDLETFLEQLPEAVKIHSGRMAQNGRKFAKLLGMDADAIENALLLHDVGKSFVDLLPDYNSARIFTDEEKVEMRIKHSIYGGEVLRHFKQPSLVELAAEFHHAIKTDRVINAKRFHDLSPEQQQGVVVVAMIDIYDAMMHDHRSYQKTAFTMEDVKNEWKDKIGEEYLTPELVDVFVNEIHPNYTTRENSADI